MFQEDLLKAAYLRLIEDIAWWSVAWVVRWTVTSFLVKLIFHGKKNSLVLHYAVYELS